MVEENIELLDLDPRQSEQESSNSGSDADSESPAGASPHIQAQPLRLKKELTLAHGIAIVTGNIIGSGIFLSPNIVLEYSGSFGLSISLWLLGAIISIVSSLSFIELATFVKDCGGESAYILKAYSFRRKRPGFVFFGSLLSFLYTWTSTFILRPAGIAVSTILFARYLIRPLYIGCSIPVYAVKLIALSAIIILAALNSYSVKLYGRIQTLFSSMKLLACAFLFFVGIGFVCSRGCFPPAFHHPFEGTTHSPSRVAIALFGVLWAYDGGNTLGFAAEEMKNVEKNLPRAMIIGLSLVTAVYIPVNLAYFAVLSYEEILAAEAVAVPFGKAALGTAGLVIIPICVAISTFGTTVGSFFSQSRIILSSAREGLFPRALGGVHLTRRTPLPAIIFVAVISAILVVTGNIDDLVDGASSATWVFYGLTIAALLIMRVTHKDEPRPYKVWLLVPILGLLVSLFLVVLPVVQKPLPSLMAFGVILLGVPVYVFLVMETPWRLKPEVFNRIGQSLSTFTNAVLNSQSLKSQH